MELPSWNPEDLNSIIIGEVVGIHIRDDVITGDRVDIGKIRPLARMGYLDYAVVDEVFAMKRPR